MAFASSLCAGYEQRARRDRGKQLHIRFRTSCRYLLVRFSCAHKVGILVKSSEVVFPVFHSHLLISVGMNSCSGWNYWMFQPQECIHGYELIYTRKCCNLELIVLGYRGVSWERVASSHIIHWLLLHMTVEALPSPRLPQSPFSHRARVPSESES